MLAMTSRETLHCPSTRGQCSRALHFYTWPTGVAHCCPYSLVKSIEGTLRDDDVFCSGAELVRQADSFYEFKCCPIMLRLREATNCYLGDIPVVHDMLPFVHDRTRILQATGTVTPCLEFFPVCVRGTQGY